MRKNGQFYLFFAISFFLLMIIATAIIGGCSADIDLESTGYFSEEPGEYYLNYYITKSPLGLNWETPSTLSRDLVKNTIAMYLTGGTTMLGHVNVELGGEDKETIYAGMGYYNDSEGFKVIFQDKTGLGLLFHNMAGLFDTEENINNSKKNFIRGKASIITFTFDEERYNQVKGYLEAYLENGEQYNYGLNNNPFLSPSKTASPDLIAMFPQNSDDIPLGAGCTAFGVSTLQELGINDMHAFEQWHSRTRAPEEFIGQYSDQIYRSEEDIENLFPMNRKVDEKVSLSKIIFKGKSWAEEDEPGKDIVYYCPDRMFGWVAAVAQTGRTGHGVLAGELISIEESPREGAYRLTVALD